MASRAERPIIPSKKSLADAYMALKATLENKLSPYFEDYGQLIEPGSPLNNDYQNLKQRVSRHVPSNEDFRNPKSMSEWSQAAALNAPMGLSTKLPPTKYSIAQDIARRKAALRPDHRGLGLPANNTNMDRAKALGYDTDVYHGTKSDITELDKTQLGINTGAESAKKGFFSAKDPQTAETYARESLRPEAQKIMASYDSELKLLTDDLLKSSGERYSLFQQLNNKNIIESTGPGKPYKLISNNKDDIALFNSFQDAIQKEKQLSNKTKALRNLNLETFINERDLPIKEKLNHQTIYPLKINTNDNLIKDYNGSNYRDESYSDLIDSAIKNNKQGVTFKNTKDGGPVTDVYAVTEPKNIRSRFAAFDPWKKDSADILASTAGAGVMAKALSGDEAEAGDNMRNNVSDSLLHAVMMQESGGNPNAVSSKGAKGLYQITDSTARNPGFGVEPLRNNSIIDQKRFAKDYLGAMLERYDGNLPVSLAAYNAGPGAVDKAGGIPDFKETKGYVANVMNTANASEDVDTSGWIDVTDEPVTAQPENMENANSHSPTTDMDTSGWIDVTDEPANVGQPLPVNENMAAISPGQQDTLKTFGHKARPAGSLKFMWPKP